MMFFLKKLISQFLMPFPVFLLLLGIGFYYWKRHHPIRAQKIILFAVLWITLLSYSPFSALLLYPLEHPYQKVCLSNSAAPRYIHVLGSGHASNNSLPLSSQLGLVSLVRVNEGVSIYNAHPGMKLIFSGYGGDDAVSNAQKNAQMAILLGVKPEDIILLKTAKDTYEEAVQAKKIIKDQPLVLVTSASHMRRASALFKKAGIHVIAAPTDFKIKKNETLWQFPSAEGLAYSEAAFHEYVGLVWSKISGLI